MPLRNLQIEVRQTRDTSASRQSPGGITFSTGGQRGSVTFPGQDRERIAGRDLMQRVLVLNGRPVAINLGVNRPLRLVQTFVQNGVVRTIGGTVLIDANSGFSARPVWRGGSDAELELAAVQSTRPGNSPSYSTSSASASTTLALPLDQWVTVAQSEDAAISNNGSDGQPAGREAILVEVRLSVR